VHVTWARVGDISSSEAGKTGSKVGPLVWRAATVNGSLMLGGTSVDDRSVEYRSGRSRRRGTKRSFVEGSDRPRRRGDLDESARRGLLLRCSLATGGSCPPESGTAPVSETNHRRTSERGRRAHECTD